MTVLGYESVLSAFYMPLLLLLAALKFCLVRTTVTVLLFNFNKK